MADWGVSETLRYELLRKIVSIEIDNETGCWFVKNCDKNKYSEISFDGKLFKSHIFSAILFHNHNPKTGKLVCHKCNRKGCWNPNHLYLGTAKDNSVDFHNTISKPYERIATKQIETKVINKTNQKRIKIESIIVEESLDSYIQSLKEAVNECLR